jgi:GTP-binding protein
MAFIVIQLQKRKFVDRMVINVQGGCGGHGCVHFLREKFRPEGPPDGGMGGNGGNVYFQADSSVSNLNHLRKSYVAQNGTNGASKLFLENI